MADSPFPWSWDDWGKWNTFLQRYYPVLSFHSQEDHSPYNVEDYMQYTSLKNDKTNEEMDNTLENMTRRGLLAPFTGSWAVNNDWHMNQNAKNRKDTLRRGDFYRKKAYVHIKTGVSQSPSVVNIQYWIFYGYNIRVGAIPVLNIDKGHHEADWEYVTTRIDTQDGRIQKIYGSQHSGGDWYTLSELDTYNDHPVLYVSKGGHANYGNTAFHVNPFPLTDVLDKDGKKWELNRDFQIVGYDQNIVDDRYRWMMFLGDWGSDGIGSPGIKEEWSSKDEE